MNVGKEENSAKGRESRRETNKVGRKNKIKKVKNEG